MESRACAPIDLAAARVLARWLEPALRRAADEGYVPTAEDRSVLQPVLALAKFGVAPAPVVVEINRAQFTCPQCGDRFRRRVHGPNPTYCTPRCRLAAFRVRRGAQLVSEAA